MKNNKLISLLNTFSKSDLFSFRKYLASPFFNEQENLTTLFDHLQKSLFTANDTKWTVTKRETWDSLFPGRKFDDTKFRRLFSDLLQLALDFIAYKQYKENPMTSRVLVLRALTDKRLKKHFAGVVRQTTHSLEQNQLVSADSHYLSYMLNKRQHEQQEHISPKSGNFHFLENADLHLDSYYFIKKLEHFSDTLGYQDMIVQSASIQMIPKMLEYLKESHFIANPVIKAWYLVILMFQNQEEETHFLELKALLELEGQFFEKQTQKNLFIHLMNYCITTKAHKGRPEYWDIVLSLYKIALCRNIIFENNKLAFNDYKNIIAIALHLKQFKWVENFIQDYTPMLPKNDQENALNYNLANVYFHQGLFEKVVEQLAMVEYQTIEYALGSKLLLTQAYFELEEIQPLDSLLDSFKVYLRRNRLISKEVKQRYLNFLRFTKKIAALAPYDEQGWEKAVGQIEKCKSLVGKKWLLEKCPPKTKYT